MQIASPLINSAHMRLMKSTLGGGNYIIKTLDYSLFWQVIQE